MGFGFAFAWSTATAGGSVEPAYVFTNAEAEALVARFSSKPANSRKSQIDAFVGALKAAGVWAKLDFLHVMAAHDEQAATRNWIADQFNASNSGCSFDADNGFTGAGDPTHIDTNALATSLGHMTSGDGSIGVWALTAPDVSYGTMGTRPAGFYHRIATNGGPSERRVRFSSSTDVLFDDGVTTGFVVASRVAGGTVRSYRNGGGEYEVTGLGDNGFPNENFSYLESGTWYSTQQVALGFGGASLTAQEVADFYAAALTYLQAIGTLE